MHDVHFQCIRILKTGFLHCSRTPISSRSGYVGGYVHRRCHAVLIWQACWTLMCGLQVAIHIPQSYCTIRVQSICFKYIAGPWCSKCKGNPNHSNSEVMVCIKQSCCLRAQSYRYYLSFRDRFFHRSEIPFMTSLWGVLGPIDCFVFPYCSLTNKLKPDAWKQQQPWDAWGRKEVLLPIDIARWSWFSWLIDNSQ